MCHVNIDDKKEMSLDFQKSPEARKRSSSEDEPDEQGENRNIFKSNIEPDNESSQVSGNFGNKRSSSDEKDEQEASPKSPDMQSLNGEINKP